MMPRKRFKRIIVLSDIEDNSDDDDFSQSHPRKRPIPRSPGQENISGFNSGPTPSLPDLSLPPTDHGPDSTNCSDAIILIDDDDDFNRAGTSTYNNLILPTSDDPDSSTCSYYSTNEDDDFNRAGTSSYTKKLPSGREESPDREERTLQCNDPGCFLEDIVSPTSIYVTNFQEKKKELVERLYDLYNRTVFDNQLPVKMDILWSKRLTSAAGQCNQKLIDDRRYSVIELSEKVCDSVDRVRAILAHEMCHAAVWIICGERNDDHGTMWQAFTRRVKRIHPELPKLTKYHNYTIHYYYNYKCSQCDKQIGRFRKIRDNKLHCRKCGGRLRQLSIS
ncbi:germ cell nuclear acidic protein-like isoform X3 [Ranitomeya variabilis]|uniref:germ cell nuclear acidic protein-like isoform X3 n=1 Tax=Ranitomeya variabilis TaxID=490064 RepID=UPI004055B81E